MPGTKQLLDRLTRSVEARKEAIATALTEGQTVMELAERISELARREGMLGAACVIAGTMARHPAEPIMSGREVAIGILAIGADDHWSGRTNDLKRSYHDGSREVAAHFVKYDRLPTTL